MEKLTATVAVCSKDRPQMLLALLETLTRQTLAPDEVLIVDNNSAVPYEQICQPYRDRLPLRIVVETIPGVSAARNRAIQEVRTDLILFTDDDCEADPDWVENIVAPFYRDPNIGAVGGQIRGDPPSNLVEEFFHAERTLGSPNP